MSLSFGVSVSVNNILALKSFYTFLFNYRLHQRPSWIERRFIIPRAQAWIEKKVMAELAELMADPSAKTASVSLNDVAGDFFAVLYIVNNPHEIGDVKEGKELFLLLAHMALEFEKIRKPRESVQHGTGQPQ